MSSPGFTGIAHPAPAVWASEQIYNLTTLSRGLFGHYLFAEASGSTRADSSGKGNDFECQGTPFTRDTGSSTPFAAVLDGSMVAESPNHRMDGLVTPWGFAIGLYLTTPAEDSAVLMHGAADDLPCGLRVLWNDEDLVFRMQTGYRAGHGGEAGYEYRNDIVIPALTAPINDWFFVSGSFRGPSTSQAGPVTENLMTLRVNGTVNSVAAMALDGLTAPDHEVLNTPWVLGTDYVGRIGPLSIYERALQTQEMEYLYNGGDWLDLPF